MNLWINCLSGNDPKTASRLGALSKSPPVDVYSTEDQRVVGHTIRYEIRNEIDLWAEIRIEDTAQRFKRAAGILASQEGEITLLAVLVTNLSREEIANLL